MKYCKYFFAFCLLWNILDSESANAQTPFEITPETPIRFKDKTNIRVFVDSTNEAQQEDVLRKLDQFSPASQIETLLPSVTYWIYQKMVSRLDVDTDLQIDSSGWKDLTSHIIDSAGQVKTLKPTGFIASHNPYLSASPDVITRSQFTSQFAVFTLKKGEEIGILTRVNLNASFPTKILSINFMDNVRYSEYRRFGLYIEGLLLGILIALTIFAWFNAIQNKDRTNLFYSLWISIALLSVSTVPIIDGSRLFEFFINIEGLRAFNSETYGFTTMVVLGFTQSIFYVMFARQYVCSACWLFKFVWIFLLSRIFIFSAFLYDGVRNECRFRANYIICM